MLTSEYKRFSVSSFELLTKGKEETVVTSIKNETVYSDILCRDCNLNIVYSEDNAIALASSLQIRECTAESIPAGITFDQSGSFYYLNSVDGTINIISYDTTDPVTVPCIGGIGSDLCQFTPGLLSDESFKKLFPGNESNKKVASGDITSDGLCGIAVGKKMIAVSDPGNHRIQCFYRQSLQLSYIIDSDSLRTMGIEVNGNDFTPWDCAFDSCGNLYVIDVNPPENSGISSRLLCISNRGHHATDIGNNVLKYPVSLFLDSSDTLYVLDRNRKAVLTKKSDISSTWREIFSFEKICQSDCTQIGIAVDKNNFIYIGEYGKYTEYDEHGKYRESYESRFYIWNSKYEYTSHISNQIVNCRRIIADPHNCLYAEYEHGIIIQLNGKKEYLREGVMYSRIFDSAYSETLWHRITLDAQIEKGCSLRIHYFAWSPDSSQNSLTTRKLNPIWLPLCHIQGADQIQPDCLLNNVKSRFIVFKFELFGDGDFSPLIKQIRIMFPHKSYLRYLPAVYQEDPIGRDITNRFLSIFESFNMEIEEQIATISRLFDPRSTTGEFLSWLGSWLGIVRDENWEEHQFRELLSQAYPLFKIRGTSECLKNILSIYTGAGVKIIEHYQYRRPMVIGADSYVGITAIVGRKFNQPLVLEESSTIGNFVLIEELEPPETPFLADAYDFTVIIDLPAPKDKQIACIRRLIDHEKPAHTRYYLRISGQGEPRIGTALLGVDTKLTHAHNPMKVNSLQSILGNSSKAGTHHPVPGTYGCSSKIGTDTYLH